MKNTNFGSTRRSARWLGGIVGAAALAVTTTGFAQSTAEDKALAVQLFDEAERLVTSGDYAHACPKYAESERLDPQLGVLLYLAECYEKNGQLASAWGSFRAAMEIAEQRGDARASMARSRSQALSSRVSRLVIEVPAEARAPGLVVKRDGAPVAETLWGSGVAVDPGTHRVSAEAPNRRSFEREVSVTGEGTEARVALIPLEPLPVEQQGGGTSAAPAATVSDGSTQRIAALGVGGLGLVGIGVGGFFGLSAQSSASDSNELCNAKNVCTTKGDDLRDQAKSKALVATIATGIGAAALAGAAVLWFTAPAPSAAPRAERTTRPAVGLRADPNGASLLVGGRF